jgi:hypothetical protein
MSVRVWWSVRAVALAAVSVSTLVGAGGCSAPPTTASDSPGLSRVATEPPPASATRPSDQPSATTTPNPTTPSSTTPNRTTGPPPSTVDGCPWGNRQTEVESYLAQLAGFGPVTVDGRQSQVDCTAIKKFQRRYGISPAEGRAGPTTADVARRLATTRTDQCPAGPGTVVCVDLTLQTVWVMRDGRVAMAPTVTRTGMKGYATPAGTFRIDNTNIRAWSTPYKVWMPYWQHFHDGMGFHETATYLHDMPIGSHGCVNMLHADAVKLWNLAGVGTRVHLFGRRPGT